MQGDKDSEAIRQAHAEGMSGVDALGNVLRMVPLANAPEPILVRLTSG